MWNHTHLCLLHAEAQLVDSHARFPLAGAFTIHLGEVLEGEDPIMRVSTLHLPPLTCHCLVLVIYWRERSTVPAAVCVRGQRRREEWNKWDVGGGGGEEGRKEEGERGEGAEDGGRRKEERREVSGK